ncbi:MAG: TIGR01440 family protein [Christensenellaceae bacterium]
MDILLQSKECAEELIEKAKLKKGNIVVVGCSTSEVAGSQIGSNSSTEVAKQIFDGLYAAFNERGIFVAFQCCEHLNRAIVIERKALVFYDEVNVVPMPKAGGALASHAYNNIDDAIVVEHIKADAGIDIGDTFIGMHLKEVAVPLRLSVNKIGSAHLTCARVRPKFIGGERAKYNPDLL